MTRTEHEEGVRLLRSIENAYHSQPLALKVWLLTHAAELLYAMEHDPDPEPEPMKRGSTSAETCRLNGWAVGDVLVDEVYAEETGLLTLTAIGESEVLGRSSLADERECLWDLQNSEWHKEEE